MVGVAVGYYNKHPTVVWGLIHKKFIFWIADSGLSSGTDPDFFGFHPGAW